MTYKAIACALICIGLNSNSAIAHEQTGSLGTSATATDYYQVSCFDDGGGTPDYLEFSIAASKASKAGPITQSLNAQLSKISIFTQDPKTHTYKNTGANKILSTSDTNDRDGSESPTLDPQWGEGMYFIMIDKTQIGAENYSFTFHCMSAQNEHTGTDIIQSQNQ